MTKHANGCPYKDSSSGKCTHKDNYKGILKGKFFCHYKDPFDCLVYLKWLNEKRLIREVKNG